jgi:hypothetical protein
MRLDAWAALFLHRAGVPLRRVVLDDHEGGDDRHRREDEPSEPAAVVGHRREAQMRWRAWRAARIGRLGAPAGSICAASGTAPGPTPRRCCLGRPGRSWGQAVGDDAGAGITADPTTARRHPGSRPTGPPDGPRAEPVAAATGAWGPLPRSWGNCPRGSPGHRLPLVALMPRWRQEYPNNRPPTRATAISAVGQKETPALQKKRLNCRPELCVRRTESLKFTLFEAAGVGASPSALPPRARSR